MTDFNLNDFRKQMEMAEIDSASEVTESLPGVGKIGFRRIRGMLDSMTNEERCNPEIIEISRQHRIAGGSGVKPYEIQQILVRFNHVRAHMLEMSKLTLWQRIKLVTSMGRQGLFESDD